MKMANVKQKILIILIWIIVGMSPMLAMDLKLTLKTVSNNNVIEVGDKFRIDYLLTFEQSEFQNKVPEIKQPENVKGCKILSFGFSQSGTQSSYVNGKQIITYYALYSLLLEAEKKGDYTFGPIEFDGIKSNKLSYEIVEKKLQSEDNEIVDLGNGNNQIFLKAKVSQSEVYSGMSVEYIVKLYHCVSGLDSYERIQLPDFKDFEFDESPTVPEQQSIEIIDGIEYSAIVLDRIYLTPTKTGKYKFKDAKYRFSINQVQYVEDPFWGMMQISVPNYYDLTVPETELIVKKFPKQTPANYLGAIGQFTISSKLSTTEAVKGQVISLTYSVSGTGNITDVVLPKIMADYSILNITEPYITHREQTIDGNIVGITRFEYSITILETGEYEIPPMELVFFNPENGDFETAVARGFTINIVENSPSNLQNHEVF